MGITKTEIVASAIIVLSLVILVILDSTVNLFYKGNDPNHTSWYRTNTSVASFTCLAICCLHFRHAPTLRWKVLIVGAILGSAGAILSLCLLSTPRRWNFEFHMIFGIDTVAMVIFFLQIFIRDKKIAISLALFVSSLVLLYINLRYVDQNKFELFFFFLLSSLIYLVLLVIYLTLSFKHWWKRAVIILIYTSAIIVMYIFLNVPLNIILFITSIDACSALFLGLWIYVQNTRHQEMPQDDQYNYLEIAGLPTRFTIKELETATGNFQAPIGEGGSGTVFKGTLKDGSIVAVKQIKGQANGEAEFTTEITIIASLQHISIVRLLGYCLTTRGDRYLIYPFFENGSLDAWIFKGEEKRAHLTWMHRYRIASDVAKALAYFHHECHHRILHLDIKPANILLDSTFRALVSDFGISKSIGKDESSVMTRARGTVGYLPPEMLVPNPISTKSDVYSYGMVLFELVGGQRNFTTVVDSETQQIHTSYFPKIVKKKMMEGKIMEVVDPCLEHEEIREEEVMVLLRVALWCIQENPELRPSTTEIVDMLEGRTPVPMPPESPLFVVQFLNVETQSSTCNQTNGTDVAILSANTISSISIQSGR